MVEALHDEHELTVDRPGRGAAAALAEPLRRRHRRGQRRQPADAQGGGASRTPTSLIACTSRDEINIIAAMFARKIAPRDEGDRPHDGRGVPRRSGGSASSTWTWSSRRSARRRSRCRGIDRRSGGAADRRLRRRAGADRGVRRRADAARRASSAPPLTEAAIPPDSKVASIIRGRGDRHAARRARRSARRPDRRHRLARGGAGVEHDHAPSGKRRRGRRHLRRRPDRGWRRPACSSSQGSGFGSSRRDVARARAGRRGALPGARVFCATGIDPSSSSASASAGRGRRSSRCATTRRTTTRRRSRSCTASASRSRRPRQRLGGGLRARPASTSPSTRGMVTAEEIVRFAHDPRTQQVAMLEGDRFEVLDITVRAESELAAGASATCP